MAYVMLYEIKRRGMETVATSRGTTDADETLPPLDSVRFGHNPLGRKMAGMETRPTMRNDVGRVSIPAAGAPCRVMTEFQQSTLDKL